MPDSTDQIIRKLEQENKSLKKFLNQKDKKLEQKDKKLEQKDKKLEQKDEELSLERSLWKRRDGALGKDADKSEMLHRIEVFDEIIGSKTKIYRATLKDKEKFQFMLERAEEFMKNSGQMPLFRDDDSRKSDPGNRCKLHLRHALLMALMHSRGQSNPITPGN